MPAASVPIRPAVTGAAALPGVVEFAPSAAGAGGLLVSDPGVPGDDPPPGVPGDGAGPAGDAGETGVVPGAAAGVIGLGIGSLDGGAMEGGDIGLGIGAADGGVMEGGDIGLGIGAADGGVMDGGDIGLGIGAADGGVMDGGDIGLGIGAADGGVMEGGDIGLGMGGADDGGMEGGGGGGRRPGGVWSTESTTTMSFCSALQLASLPLMKKKGPERSSVKTVLPPWNLLT